MLRSMTIAMIALLPLIGVAQHETILVKGTIKDHQTGDPLAGAHITVYPHKRGTVSEDQGGYTLKIAKRRNTTIRISFLGYAAVEKSIRPGVQIDTVLLNINLSQIHTRIAPVRITARSSPDTVCGSFTYCVADFEFYQDKFLLLTYASRDPNSCSLMLRNKKGKLLITAKAPGKATSLYRDYDDRYYVICEKKVLWVNIESSLLLMVPMSIGYFEAHIRPGIDMVGDKILFSDYRWNHPKFSYYTIWKNDTTIEKLKTVTDEPLMRMYRFEYYYLNNAQRVAAWKLADRYAGFDRHDAAALMTGFQHSLYYDALYAPVFVVNDTVLIFDHYANKLYRYDMMNRAVDSVEIAYHKNSGAMKWKKEMVKDESNGEIYAVFQKNGYYYLNNVDTKVGKLGGTFKMSDKYTEKMKIKDDYVYYVYDPQDKYQTPFLYREQIRL